MNCPNCQREVIPHIVQQYSGHELYVRREYYCLRCGWRGHTINDAVIEDLPDPIRVARTKAVKAATGDVNRKRAKFKAILGSWKNGN